MKQFLAKRISNDVSLRIMLTDRSSARKPCAEVEERGRVVVVVRGGGGKVVAVVMMHWMMMSSVMVVVSGGGGSSSVVMARRRIVKVGVGRVDAAKQGVKRVRMHRRKRVLATEKRPVNQSTGQVNACVCMGTLLESPSAFLVPSQTTKFAASFLPRDFFRVNFTL